MIKFDPVTRAATFTAQVSLPPELISAYEKLTGMQLDQVLPSELEQLLLLKLTEGFSMQFVSPIGRALMEHLAQEGNPPASAEELGRMLGVHKIEFTSGPAPEETVEDRLLAIDDAPAPPVPEPEPAPEFTKEQLEGFLATAKTPGERRMWQRQLDAWTGE